MPAYKVYFDNGKPLFTELHSFEIPKLYPQGIFGKKLIDNQVYEFLIVIAPDERTALIQAKEDAERPS
jgi:hypothetical protein